LQGDLAGEHPIYLYWPKDRSRLVYSRSITTLLDDSRVPKPLAFSNEGMSFMLQNGVAPPPRTSYEEIYILGIGDEAKIFSRGDMVEVEFTHDFPFSNRNRCLAGEMDPDEDKILEMLATATISRIDPRRPSFLFHSAGKDSNSIALALAEAGWQKHVTLITHKSKGQADESEISAKFAKKLGFKHRILQEVDQLQPLHHQSIDHYFANAPFPCTDNVTLAYPLYAVQIPELQEANLIDGGGNDSYMATPPTERELKTNELAKLTSRLPVLRNYIKSESMLNSLLKTPAEWWGMTGFSLADANRIYPGNVPVYSYWQNESKIRKDWDVYDFKTDVLTTRTAAEVHIRKVRNFSDTIGSKLILPFCDEKIADYFAKLPESYLFDRKTLKNKLILRKIINEKMGLDSDKVGKKGFSYDSRSVVLQNWEVIIREIYDCSLWSRAGVERVITRLKHTVEASSRYSPLAAELIYRIYLISKHSSKNKYC